jgi:hypothetical protein
MATYHVSIKSKKPGEALENFLYITRQGVTRPCKLHELFHWECKHFPSWAKDPGDFFEAADKYERSNGAVYREIEISLPNELTREQNVDLGRKMTDDLLGPRPRVLAFHEKEGTVSGELHPHLHAMYSDRPCDGLDRPKQQHFARFNAKDPGKGGVRKLSGGKTPAQVFGQARETRRHVAEAINEALAQHGSTERVDHRSLQDQGVARAGERYLGPQGVKRLSDEARRALLAKRALKAKQSV